MLWPLLLAAAVGTCPVEDAEYRLRGTADVTARFYAVQKSVDWNSGLAFRVHVARSGRSYWFLPWQGGTDGRTNLAWVKERSAPIQLQSERRDLQFFAMDASYAIAAAIPKQGQPAPDRILIPDLSRLIWTSTTDPNREDIPRAFFDLTTCAKTRDVVPQIDFPAIP